MDDFVTAVMEIRPEAPGDIAAIHALVAACFPSDAEGRLIDAPRAAGRLSLSLVAIEDGQVVGHIGFSPMTGLAGGLGLAPLAVQIDHRRRGIGAQLAREGLAACSRLGGAIRHGVGLIRYAPESAAL
ncbi:MAG: N-acetyltransferase [Thermoflexales bacterium]